jgi:uncharacterized protein YjeT (DUF2065 family)
MTLSTLLLGLGMVLVFEGLVFALAPSRFEDMLRLIQQVPLETRRLIGLVAVAAGAVIVSWAISTGGGM